MKSTGPRPGNRYLNGAPGIAALSAARATNTYRSAQYQRIATRRCPMRAVVAVEHAMVFAAWNLLVSGDLYRKPRCRQPLRTPTRQTSARVISQLHSDSKSPSNRL